MLDNGCAGNKRLFRGKVATYGFDDRRPGRRVSKVPDPTLGEPTVNYSYNIDDTRAAMSDASGMTTYTYDDRERLLTKATPEGTLTYTYDPSGNVASIDSSNANGTSVSYAWDAANQLVAVTDNRLGGMTTAAYTATGRPSSLVQANGVGARYGYDSLDRALSLAWQKGTDPAVATWTYGYNQRGQRLSSTDVTGREAAYGYDRASRLTSETVTGDQSGPSGDGALTYTLDPVGNRLTRSSTLAALGAQSFEYDASDELTSDGYDLNGNTTSADGHSYGYDFENRLVSKDAGVVTVVYDGDGTRIAKTAGGVTTKYLVDDLNPTGYAQVMEEVSDASAQVRYTYGNRLVSQTRNASGAPATSFYGYDAHGNISFLTDHVGAVTDTYHYDAWGNLDGSTGTTLNGRLYAGEEFDSDFGLINLRARYYDPSRGRFLTGDPLDDSSDDDVVSPLARNRYLFAKSIPTIYSDPQGRAALAEYAAFLPIIAAGALVPVNLNLGTNGHYTAVQTTIGVAVGLKVACTFLTVADQLAQRLLTATSPGAETPPFAPPFEDCTGCKPCKGPLPERLDKVPPGKPHFPCPGNHIHTFEWHQDPNTCACFMKKKVICL